MTVRARIERIALLHFVPPAALDPEQNPLLRIPRLQHGFWAAAGVLLAIAAMLLLAMLVGRSLVTPTVGEYFLLTVLAYSGLIFVALCAAAPWIGLSIRTDWERHPVRTDLPLLPQPQTMMEGAVVRPVADLMVLGLIASLVFWICFALIRGVFLWVLPILVVNFALGLGLRATMMILVPPWERFQRYARLFFLWGVLLFSASTRMLHFAHRYQILAAVLEGALLMLRAYYLRFAISELRLVAESSMNPAPERRHP